MHLRTAAPALLALLAMTGCEHTQNLDRVGCLPLQVPAEVTLTQAAGLFRVRDRPTLSLIALPRDTTNDGFHGITQVRVLPPGERVTVESLSQHHGFDVGKGAILAVGQTAQGEDFQYGWGGGTEIYRAPWESPSLPARRQVDCGE